MGYYRQKWVFTAFANPEQLYQWRRSFQTQYNNETLAAMQEARDIASGKIQTKSYSSFQEMIDEINAEGLDDSLAGLIK